MLKKGGRTILFIKERRKMMRKGVLWIISLFFLVMISNGCRKKEPSIFRKAKSRKKAEEAIRQTEKLEKEIQTIERIEKEIKEMEAQEQTGAQDIEELLKKEKTLEKQEPALPERETTHPE